MVVLLEIDNWKKFHRGSHDAVCTFFFSSTVTLKIHPTLPVGEKGGEKPCCLIALYVPLKERVLEKRKAEAFRCCLNKDMEMWGEAASEVSNTGTQAAFFCCWRSEKLFPVISHLVTSRTNILLLLTQLLLCYVFFPLPTDRWYKSFDNAPPVLKELACVVPL